MKKFYFKIAIILSLVAALEIQLTCSINVDELFNKLSYEEKCGQMTQLHTSALQRDDLDVNPNGSPFDAKKLNDALNVRKVGSILGLVWPNVMKIDKWQQVFNEIHNATRSNNIPVLFGIDSIHAAGFIDGATFLPQPLSMAASFSVEVAEKCGSIIAMEHRATGSPWNFSPVLDAGRQPLWPRMYETMGEDGHLILKMSTAYIRGHHGGDHVNEFKNRKKAATCLKHYVGYGIPFNGRDRSPAYLPENALRDFHLIPFENGVRMGTPTVMINSGHLNGVPGHANRRLLTEILKEEFNFDGFVVSDWEDIKRLYTRDKVAATLEEAARIAVLAGVDMSMVPFDYSFLDHCISLTKKSAEFARRVDDAVKRILSVKNRMGLFENPYPDPLDQLNVDTDESFEFNLRAARESIILAKNEAQTLPIKLSSERKRRIVVSGPTANLVKVLNGGWSLGSNEADYHKYGRKKYTVFEALANSSSSSSAAALVDVQFIEGANLTHLTNLNVLIEAIESSREVIDYVVLCVGEDVYAETDGNINNLMLDKHQHELVERVAQSLKNSRTKLILVYLGGRPRIITRMVDKADAVLVGFLPGDRGGEAIADILMGKFNPSAKMPITYPRYVNAFSTYDHRAPESEYPLNVLFPFGHGLSFTKFTFSNLKLNATRINAYKEALGVSVVVKNEGEMSGQAVVLAFLNDEYASITRPVRQLKHFSKLNLMPGEQREIRFELTTKDFEFHDSKNRRVCEQGFFNIYVDELTARFELIK